jgi:hypothetical protein
MPARASAALNPSCTFLTVAVWPVFLWRHMHEDAGRAFSVGQTVSWDVLLVDGEALGWPGEVLIETSVVIEPRPAFALHGSLARTPDISACWRGEEPVGTEFQIRAGLVADLLNLPFFSTVTGIVRRIQVVSYRMAPNERGVWGGTGPWTLAEVDESPRWLGPRRQDRADEQDVGFLIGLDVASHEIRPFPIRPEANP